MSKSDADIFMSTIPGDFQVPEPENDFDLQFLEQIESVGWYNLPVAEDPEKGLPQFSFSIGHFYKHNHPEIIVMGLKPEQAVMLLNVAAVKIMGANERIEPYTAYDDFTETLSVMFIPVALEHYPHWMGYANWFYGSMPRPYPTLQMVWPDPEGKFPWDEGYDERFMSLQLLLGSS